MKNIGTLMPVASIPARHGIGDFGKESYRFIDMLAQTRMNLWQILPLNPMGFGNSPYQPYSSFAGDEIYISLDLLIQEGLLDAAPSFHSQKNVIDYTRIRTYKNQYLKKAFHIFQSRQQEEEYRLFTQEQWVQDYAVFMMLKKKNRNACWNEWPKEEQNWIIDHAFDLTPYMEEIQYELFLQYEFIKQWNCLKEYANNKGIQIIGDIPMYVGLDSLDVWANQECFLLGADHQPSFVAGVPPDYFSATGQRWGNPIYHWDYIREHNFTFWLKRLQYCSKIFDITRIDHFRAFDTYWKIPASCKTAVDGEWMTAPGYEFFDELFCQNPDINIIVEDLGYLRPEVHKLRDHYSLKGMCVIQFTFLSDDTKISTYQEVENSVLYTGTHDNQTTRSWYQGQSKEMKKKIYHRLSEEGYKNGPISWKFFEFACKLPTYMSIIPMQDLLNLDDKARLNTPGTLGSPNWEWRMKSLEPFREKIDQIKAVIQGLEK